MKNFLEKIRSFFSHLNIQKNVETMWRATTTWLVSRLKRQPKSEPIAQAETAASASRTSAKVDRFTIISWGVTALIVVALLASTILYKSASASSAINSPQPTLEPGITQP